jgi:hypothetical protein
MSAHSAIDRSRLESVLEATGPAHHAAYIDTDGEDPEWPRWYARHLIEDLRSIFSRPDLTESRLVWALVTADDAYNSEQSTLPCYEFHATRFISEFSANG